VREVTLRYCTASGEVVTTPLHAARAETIVSGLPIRIPPTYRGQHNYPGLFWAATNRRTLVYESLLELDRLWLADFDSTAVGIATQPFQIAWREGSATRFHVPDVLLTHADRRVNVIDVKPESLVNKPEVKRQFVKSRVFWRLSVCSVVRLLLPAGSCSERFRSRPESDSQASNATVRY
jgi:hypothetical protein